MDSRSLSYHLSLSLGLWGRTNVRVSLLLILVLPVLWTHLGWSLGTVVFGVLFASVLFHEFCHIWMVRLTGGEGSEILLWPAGGLAYCRPADTFRSEFWTACAGPLSNLFLAALAFWPAVRAGVIQEPFDLLRQMVFLPNVTLESKVALDLMALTFSLNWKLFWLNLLPVYPLDGGRMMQAILAQHLPRWEAHRRCIIIAIWVCAIVIFLGMIFNDVWIVSIGFIALGMNVIEWVVTRRTPQFEDSFLGHDFSEGYTSLERDEPVRERRPGYFERRRLEREEKRRQREEQLRIDTENRVDQLLDKIQTQGIQSLTSEERQFLEQASAHYRQDKPR